MNYEGRIRKIQKRLEAEDLDALVVAPFLDVELPALPNIRYLCGFTGSSGYLLVTRESATFLTDGRYETQCPDEVEAADIEVYKLSADLGPKLRQAASRSGAKRIGYESGIVSMSGLQTLQGYLPDAELVPAAKWVEELRKSKDPEEIDVLRTAAEMADEGFRYILERIEVGKTERELALDLEFYLRSQGADDVSFESIVASAERSALPHADPSDKEVEKGSFLLFDFGCRYRGYCSDLTRTVVIGPAEDRHREVYQAVDEAQELALGQIKPGMVAHDADHLARAALTARGFGDAFTHGLGHAVGLEIHEEPKLTRDSKDVLQEGHALTIEPGLYFPGWGGVRIEDLAVVTPSGLEVLSGADKSFIEL